MVCEPLVNYDVSELQLGIIRPQGGMTVVKMAKFLVVICFTWRDYDRLWQTFPEAVKDLGRLWRDTGLVDEDSQSRPAMETWRTVLERR